MARFDREKLGTANGQSWFPFQAATELKGTRRSDFGFLRPLKPTVVFETYWRFAAERQEIFFKRVRNVPPPWTDDPVLQQHKFTNTYRASDRVSQYLIRKVIYNGDQSADEVCFRVLLFKFFNRIETWEFLEEKFGEICWSDFNRRRYEEALTKWMDQDNRVYSAAYIMPSGGRHSDYARKHQMHLALVEQMMDESIPERIRSVSSMSAAFKLLRAYPTIGDFLAYQYVTDLNYSTLLNFKETDFVVAGPGAKDGVRKCFSDLGGLTEDEAIRFICERQRECFMAIGVDFLSLWGRPLQLIDCQSLFCEVDKYARVAHPEFAGITGRSRVKQKFRPHSSLPEPWYPPKWGLNQLINKEHRNVSSLPRENR